MLGSLILTAACRDAVITTDPASRPAARLRVSCARRTARCRSSTRKVTAIHATSGARYETTTGVNGGYTIKVPEEGRYRIEVELREGEVIAKGPGETDINNGDLDPGRDFEITVGKVAKSGSPVAGVHFAH